MKVHHIKTARLTGGDSQEFWEGFACADCIGATNASGIGFPRVVGEIGPAVEGACQADWWYCRLID